MIIGMANRILRVATPFLSSTLNHCINHLESCLNRENYSFNVLLEQLQTARTKSQKMWKEVHSVEIIVDGFYP